MLVWLRMCDYITYKQSLTLYSWFYRRGIFQCFKLVMVLWWVLGVDVGPGGYSDMSWTGVPLKLQNPYSSLRVIVAKTGYPFLRIFFVKNKAILGLFFKNFAILEGFTWQKPPKLQNFVLIQKSWPMFKDFLVKNGTHV